MALPPRLGPVLADLLAKSEADKSVSLDAIGEALGTMAVSYDEVEALIVAIEKAGWRVVGPEGARGTGNLRRVLPAARALAAKLGRKPTLAELAAETGLREDDVRHALALGRVMGR
jgi:hypothetical protein